MTNKQIVRRLILREVERMEPKVQSFEDNPIEFLLQRYPTLNETLEMLMTSAFKDYITGIYIIAPKPTTFKIVLHNGQTFTLIFLGEAYQAKVGGKKFYLKTVGERERGTNAIAGLLTLGNPIETKGPGGPEKTAGEEPEEGVEPEAPGETEAEETES